MDETTVKALTKAIAYNENGGKPDIKHPVKGKSGEMKSIFQFTPATWKSYSKQVFGKDDVPLTPDTESAVMLKKVSEQLQKGYTPEQILSMHNAGIGEPDAYSGKFSNGSSSSGTNNYGVPYNVKGYVAKGMKYFNQFLSEKPSAETAPEMAKTEKAGMISQPTQSASPTAVPGLLPTMG